MTKKRADRLDPKKLKHIMELKGKTAADATHELNISSSSMSRYTDEEQEPIGTTQTARLALWLRVPYEALLADDPDQYPQMGGLLLNNQRAHLPAVRSATPAIVPVIGVTTGDSYLTRETMIGLTEMGARAQSVPLDETYPQLSHFIFRVGTPFNDGIERIEAGESLVCIDASELPIEKGELYVVERTNDNGEVNFSIRRARPFKDHAELSDGKTTITIPEEGTRVVGLVSSIVRKPRRL